MDLPKIRRPLIDLPGWDGRLAIAALFILGYYVLIFRLTGRDVPAANASLIRDALLVLGPPIGVIIGSIFRTTLADERSSARRSSDLQTALRTPTVPTEEIADDVRAGSRQGTREGVTAALTGAQAPDEGTEIIS